MFANIFKVIKHLWNWTIDFKYRKTLDIKVNKIQTINKVTFTVQFDVNNSCELKINIFTILILQFPLKHVNSISKQAVTPRSRINVGAGRVITIEISGLDVTDQRCVMHQDCVLQDKELSQVSTFLGRNFGNLSNFWNTLVSRIIFNAVCLWLVT